MTGGATLASALAEEVVVAGTDVPVAVSEAAVLRILDTVAVAAAGTRTAAARATRSVALATPAKGAPVWGSGKRAPGELAVLANATAAHALDYDDVNYEAIMHAGALVVPVALAVGEEVAASGPALLEAIVAGYQVGCYLGQRAFRCFQPRGFHSTSVLGVFAGVATAGVLRKVPEATLVDAFGIAGSMASGLMEFLKSGGDTKPLQVGWAARSALAALCLAEAGASGPSTVLEGEYGVFRSFAGTDVGAAEDWPSLRGAHAISRAATKFYEVCGAIHGPADAWKQLLFAMAEDGVDPFDDVASIACTLSDFAARLVCYPEERKRRPATAHEARFSLAWCLARLALDGDIGRRSFLDDVLFEPRGLDLASRVSYRILDAAEESRTLAIVEATTRSGRTYRAEVGPSSREGRAPERIREKVRRALDDAGAPDVAGPLIDAAYALQGDGSAAGLSRVLDEMICEGAR